MRLGVLALCLLPTIAWGDCATERSALFSVLENNRWTIDREGLFFSGEGRCRVSNIEISEENLELSISNLEWKIEGLTALQTGRGGLSLSAKIDNLQFSPRAGDAWASYLLKLQNQRNLIDASLRLNWDIGGKELVLSSLQIDLAGDNRIDLSSRVTGLGGEVLTGSVSELASVGVVELNLAVENRGFADGLILGFLAGQLSTLPGAPEAVVEATKSEAQKFVAGLPDDLLSNDSKSSLERLIDHAPLPWGKLIISLSADPALPIARFPILALQRDPTSPEALSAAFSGADISIDFAPDVAPN